MAQAGHADAVISVCHICCVTSLNTVPVEGLLVSPKICHGNRLCFSLIYIVRSRRSFCRHSVRRESNRWMYRSGSMRLKKQIGWCEIMLNQLACIVTIDKGKTSGFFLPHLAIRVTLNGVSITAKQSDFTDLIWSWDRRRPSLWTTPDVVSTWP